MSAKRTNLPFFSLHGATDAELKQPFTFRKSCYILPSMSMVPYGFALEGKPLKRLLIGFGVIVLGGLLIWEFRNSDRFSWPNSAHHRIENMASILRSIEGPARWCNLLRNSLNPYNGVYEIQEHLEQCISRISPASDFEEVHPKEYIRRFYRASMEGKICEVTLSTVWDNDRIVGSDCYYGIFYDKDDTGVGMTADPFG